MQNYFEQISTSDWIQIGIWVVALVAIVAWGHTFRRKQKDIVGNRKYYYMFSGVLLSVAIAGLCVKGLNYGLDFTGGSIIELGSPQKVTCDAAAISNFVTAKRPKYDVVTQLSADMTTDIDGKTYQKINIRVRDGEGAVALDTDQVEELIQCVKDGLNDQNIMKIQETSIGPTISGELKRSAIVALIVSLFFQLIYITWRFGSQLRYGVAADIALLHDVIVMVGFYAWAGHPVDSSFVAAVLTIAGYSVMDSVVIFDRIREHGQTESGVPFPDRVNHSINETMTRSINTSLTTIVVCVSLYYFGGSTLQGFAYALLVGVMAGAYSSIFIASPILVELDVLAKKRDANRQAELRLAAEESARESESEGGASRSVARSSRSVSHENRPSRSASEAPSASGRPRRRVKGTRR
ncbi:MAG: protein translocase subunit SecF [bacterium]|nr:protein translocase subunit SecF [bacterium]